MNQTLIVFAAIAFSLVVVVFGVLKLIASFRKTVPPNTVAVVSGRKYAGGKGYRTITGGGFFLIPILERVDYISLNVMSFPVEVRGAPDKNGVPLTVKGVANVKIRSEAEPLALAVERFLGKNEDEIKNICKENLEGNLRSIVGTSTVESLIGDRQTFQKSVLDEAGIDMAKLGIAVDILNIQDIQDDRGYIDALGKKRTAEVVRDATIGEAEAKRDADIKSAKARQEGQVATANADQEISNAERERDEIKARNAAKVQGEQARIQIVAETAAAEEQKSLNVAQVAAEQARVEAEITLQDAVRRRTEAELNATTIVQAEKKKEARIIEADAEQEAASREGEAFRIKAEKEGLGKQARDTGEAEGRKALANAIQAEREAEAAGQKALLLAEADGIRAKLLAEAEGVLKKAEAFRELDEAGRILLIIEALPPVIEAFGVHVVTPAAQAIGQGLGNVDEIRIIDMGGGANNGKGGNILQQFANMPVESLYGMLQKIMASDMGPALQGLLSKAGIDLSQLSVMVSSGLKPDASSEAKAEGSSAEVVEETPATETEK